MKYSLKPMRIFGTLALLILLSGCATSPQATPDLLAAAGFKPVTADTPEKQALLKTLPTGQLSLIKWKGKSLYVQPDVANNRAMVGTPAEYQAYQQLRLANQMSNDNLIAAQMNDDAMMNWGVWGPGLYGGFYGGRFR